MYILCMKKIKTTLAIPFCDKDYCLEPLIKSIDEMDLPREEMKLMVLDVSGNPVINKRLSEWVDSELGFAKQVYVSRPQANQIVVEPLKTVDPATFMRKRWLVADTKNLLLKFLEGDMFMVEEDTLCPPKSYRKMRAILDEYEDAGAATGVNYSRNGNTGQGDNTCWKFITDRPFPFGDLMPKTMQLEIIRMCEKPFGIEPIGSSGNGCMLVRKEIIENYRFVGASSLSGQSGSDVNFGYYITQLLGKYFIVDWSIKTKHLGFDEEFEKLEVYTSIPYGMDYDWDNS